MEGFIQKRRDLRIKGNHFSHLEHLNDKKIKVYDWPLFSIQIGRSQSQKLVKIIKYIEMTKINFKYCNLNKNFFRNMGSFVN